MSNSLFCVSGKNVLVTGGSRGIGYMIAKGYTLAGANVIITSRDEKACSVAADELKCQFITSNIANREGCAKLVSEVKQAFHGKLHVLVNNVRGTLFFSFYHHLLQLIIFFYRLVLHGESLGNENQGALIGDSTRCWTLM
jgi:NAD(P)-dependent dehydrogenase (short-subunit alcohol dehydrogenase family)